MSKQNPNEGRWKVTATDKESLHVHITLAPGALDHVPLNALIPFLLKHNLVIEGTEIRRAE